MNVKSWRTILGEMVGDARNESSAITDWNVGTPQRALLRAVAIQAQQIWVRLKRVYRASKILTAMSDDLDDQVMARGLTRYAAARAGVSLRFTGTEGSPVPSGTRVSTKSGISFCTVEGGTISMGETYVDLDAEADVAGLAGNVSKDTITELTGSLEGITSVTNPYPASGGVDSETDEELRNRAMNQLATISQGIQASYQAWAIEANSEVLRAKARRVDDYTGLVYVYLVKRSGTPFTILERNAIAEYIRSKAPIAANIYCFNATFKIINIGTTVRLEEGYVLLDVDTYMTANFAAYLDWRTWDWGQDVQKADLMAFANNTEGVQDLITSKFNPTQNVELGAYELPKLGYVTVAESEEASPPGEEAGT